MPLEQNGPPVFSFYKGGPRLVSFLLFDYLWETISPVNSSAIRLSTTLLFLQTATQKELILYFTDLILQGLQS